MRYLQRSSLILPGLVVVLLFGTLLTPFTLLPLMAIGIGMTALGTVAVRQIHEGSWSLDYIAFIAMVLATLTHEYLAGVVIALMYTSGEALETYASHRAEASLASLLARIPKTALVKTRTGALEEKPLATIPMGTTIVIRGGELVPLDGLLASPKAILNLANLTGEPLPEETMRGAVVKSGSVNAGEAFDLTVSGTLATSTYAKIVSLVQNAQLDQAPLVRLAERANIPFTLLTLGISGCAYFVTHDILRVLAVLVIATPCPLIIAAPVAFIGGLSRAARKNIIVKTPVVLETIARVTTLFFDKTGTLTLGEPRLTDIVMIDPSMGDFRALTLAASLEFHSIHPLAKAVITAAKARGVSATPAQNAKETVGTGIEGSVDGHHVSLAQAPEAHHRPGTISLVLKQDAKPVATFHFADVLKDHAKKLLVELSHQGFALAVLTGDRLENAQAVFAGLPITIHAGCTPEEKYRIVDRARSGGAVVGMIGDGLNDAPALARADVGIVFSGTENSASIEAADVAILSHNVALIHELFLLSKRSVRIARQSIGAGIGLSTLGMLFAAAGSIAPVQGALLQEGIDTAVIVNALRAAFSKR